MTGLVDEPPAIADPPDGLPPGYGTYAEAMAALAPPRVFEDRPSHRLLTARPPVLRLGPARYFDGVNVGESVAHELAAGVAGLPLRTRIGDPCDLTRRAALPAITTLTVTSARAASYVLHRRDPAKVAADAEPVTAQARRHAEVMATAASRRNAHTTRS